MWLIVRKKASVNEVLKNFCPEYQAHGLRVRDIIKFGRVNFKITTLKCDRMNKEFQGSCYMQMKVEKRDKSSRSRLDTSQIQDHSVDRSMDPAGSNLTEMHLNE
jgi:hypothetical protein